jgi:hypothetical protein
VRSFPSASLALACGEGDLRQGIPKIGDLSLKIGVLGEKPVNVLQQMSSAHLQGRGRLAANLIGDRDHSLEHLCDLSVHGCGIGGLLGRDGVRSRSLLSRLDERLPGRERRGAVAAPPESLM